MHRFINDHDNCAILSPAALASAAYAKFADDAVEPHVAYGCLEHFKGMARKVLAGSFADDGEGNQSYADQGELFSGHLQDRYPLPRAKGADPVYKLRHLLTPEERAWNVKTLRKSGEARLAHADALEAEGISRAAA
jgi:hypothetical protein